MNSASNTNFLNSQNRRIYQGKSGGFFVMKKDGTKKYKPTAAFRRIGDGAKTKVTAANANVPTAIRRKTRSNAGAKRTMRTPNEGDLTRKLFASPKARKPAAKKAGPVKRPGRKPVTARGMMKAGMSPNEGALFRNIFRTPPKPAARKPAAKKTGPAKRPGRKPTTVRGMMKAGMSPNEGALFRNIFRTPPKSAARKPAAKKAGPAKRPGRKPTTVRGMMKAGMSPNAGDLTRMLFASPKKVARKPRAAPKSRVMKSPKATRPMLNLIVVSPGGTSKVQKVRKPRSAVGAMKKAMTPNAGDLTRMLMANYDKPIKPRKTRKNKGVKRGPRGIKGMRANANPFQALA